MDINKLNQLLNQSKLTQEIGEEEDIIAERPADLGGQGRIPITLPNPVDAEEEELGSNTEQPRIETKDVITGRKETITSKQTKQSDASKQIQNDLDKAAEDEFKAKAELMKLAQKKQTIEFNENQAKEKIIAEATAKEQEIRNQGIQDFEQRLSKLDQATNELANREYEGYWANKGTGNKIIGAISLALGTFGSSLGGGPNTALQIINKAMDDDFRAYQDATQNKIKAIQSSRLNISTKKELVQQQLDALGAKKLADIQVINSRIENLKNKFAKPELQAKLDELKVSLDTKRLKERQKIEDKYAEEINTQVTQDVATLQVDPATNQVVKEIDQALEIPGYGQARTKEEAVKLRERKTSTDEANAAASRIRDIWTGKSTLNPLNRKDLAKLQTELGLIQGAMRLSLIGPGAVTDAEREFMKGLIGDPSKIFGLESIEKEKLETIINKMNVGLESEAKNVVVGYKGKPEAQAPKQIGATKVINGITYEKVDGGWKRVK